MFLTNIIIPNGITSIGNHTFDHCNRLTNVIIPNSVTNIGEYAFARCISLTNINIPNSVTSIGEGAFKECSKIPYHTKLDIIKRFGTKVFYLRFNII